MGLDGARSFICTMQLFIKKKRSPKLKGLNEFRFKHKTIVKISAPTPWLKPQVTPLVIPAQQVKKYIYCISLPNTLWTIVFYFIFIYLFLLRGFLIKLFKGELGELQIYFRKIPLHQKKILVVSVLSNSPWLREIWKNVPNETTKLFSVGNTFRQATMHARIFCICCAMTWISPMVKSRRNMKKKR